MRVPAGPAEGEIRDRGSVFRAVVLPDLTGFPDWLRANAERLLGAAGREELAGDQLPGAAAG